MIYIQHTNITLPNHLISFNNPQLLSDPPKGSVPTLGDRAIVPAMWRLPGVCSKCSTLKIQKITQLFPKSTDNNSRGHANDKGGIMLPPEIIEKIRRERDESNKQPVAQIPLPAPELIHSIQDPSNEPEEITSSVYIIDLA